MSKQRYIDLPTCPDCDTDLVHFNDSDCEAKFRCGSVWVEQMNADWTEATGLWEQVRPCATRKPAPPQGAARDT